MTSDRLERLLRESVAEAQPGPISDECLGFGALLRILDDPKQMRQDERDHLVRCGACQRSVALARRERALWDAPLSAEPAPPIRVWRRIGPASAVAAVAAVAAVVVLSVTLGRWAAPPSPSPKPAGGLLANLRVVPFSGTRGEPPNTPEYGATVDLMGSGFLMWVRVDGRGTVMLPHEAAEPTAERPPQLCFVPVGVVDDGPVWVAAVASRAAFDPQAVLGELQRLVDGAPHSESFDDLVQRLEVSLRQRGFEVLGPKVETKDAQR